MKHNVFTTPNGSMSITISAKNEREARSQIFHFFLRSTVYDLRLEKEEDEDE